MKSHHIRNKQQLQQQNILQKQHHIPPMRFSRRGQMLMEALWLVLFAFAFLTMLSHLYEKGRKEIQTSRFSD